MSKQRNQNLYLSIYLCINIHAYYIEWERLVSHLCFPLHHAQTLCGHYNACLQKRDPVLVYWYQCFEPLIASIQLNATSTWICSLQSLHHQALLLWTFASSRYREPSFCKMRWNCATQESNCEICYNLSACPVSCAPLDALLGHSHGEPIR